ncbi:hypothetical protein [Methylomonas sp. TEB]|uniref:hypothetical protein n=1 Tax=Methylomonas sp. TEB TaxID=3398229 RepID=UPI0039F63BFB
MNDYHNRCLWISEQNELHIDLSDLLNDNRILVLTAWNHCSGITLSLVTDDSIEKYDPFTAPYFPIWECLDYDSCRDYLEQIPSQLLAMLKSYRADSFGMLMLISQNKFLTNFYGKYSTLFWLFFRQAKIDHWSKSEFLDVCNQGEFAMLIACQLPANTVALDVIAKFTANNYSQYQYDLICRLFEALDYQHLNSVRDFFPDHLIQFLLRYPELQHAKLIQNLKKSEYNELPRIVRNLRAVVAKLKIDTVNVEKLIAESGNLAALKSHYNHLEALALEKALQDYEKQLKSAEASSRSFPQLSLFADRDDHEQILSEAELLAESWLCQQNLMQYVPGILCGHYAIYQQRKPQRATAVYYLFPEQDGGLRPVLKCLYSADEAK